MNISELIEKLEVFKKEHGDLEVGTQVDGFGGRAVYEASGKLDTDMITFNEITEEGDFDDEDARKIFSQEDIDNDTEKEILVIHPGLMFYST